MKKYCWLFLFVLFGWRNVLTQSFTIPLRAVLKDSSGKELTLAENKITTKKLNDSLYYILADITPSEVIRITDLDIPVTYPIIDQDLLKQQFHWLPTINKRKGQIIPQHQFRSPAMLFTLNNQSLVMIPDIELLEKNKSAPYYMQAEYTGNGLTLHYGLSDYKVIPHQYFEKSGKSFKVDKKMQIGFYLLNPKTKDPLTVLAMTNEFLWRKFALPYTSFSLPVSFSRYASTGYGMAIDHYWINAGNQRGGIALSTFYDKETKRYRGRDSKDDLWFQSWFNNMRTAYGMFVWGKVMKSDEWRQKAVETVRLLLSTPVNKGWFPTIYNTQTNSWMPSSQQEGKVYHLPDNAWAAYWLLRFTDELQPQKDADSWLLAFGNAIINSQNADGSFPTMVDRETLRADNTLNSSASSAMGTWYLEELMIRKKVPAAENVRYTDAINRSLKFLSRDILPLQKFEDFENYFSCAPKPMHYYDTTTYLFTQNTLSIQWCAQAFLKAYQLFGRKTDLNDGEYCLNILSLYQQVWSPSFINFYAFGGFGTQNTDAEWSDARQAQFADTYLQYFQVTQKKEYSERALAALKASFVLMVLPEHKDICPQNYNGTSFNGEIWPGSMAENFGHGGNNKRSGQSGFHWGTGSALTTAAIFQKAGLISIKDH